MATRWGGGVHESERKREWRSDWKYLALETLVPQVLIPFLEDLSSQLWITLYHLHFLLIFVVIFLLLPLSPRYTNGLTLEKGI